MKQTLFMIALTLYGSVGAFYWGPATAVSVYYCFAVLRPQFLWEWALPMGIGWSQYVALAAMASTLASSLGLVAGSDTAAPHRRTALQVATLSFGFWIVVTYATAYNRDVAWIWFLEYLKIFVMFALAAHVVTAMDQITVIYRVVTASLIYIAYEVNITYLTVGRIDIYHRGYGGLDNNGAGLMLAMGVPLAIFASESSSRWWRYLFAAGIPLLLHAVLMTYSRGAMLSLLVGLPYALTRSAHKGRALIVALLLAAMVPFFAGQEIRERFFTLQQYGEDESANSRFDSWIAAVRIAGESPIFGVGIRNSNLMSQAFGADMEGRTIHSQYLQTLADSGYVGLALYLGMIGTAVFTLNRIRRALRGRPGAPDTRLALATASGIEGALIVFCVGASFLSLEVFELPYILMLLTSQLWVVARALNPASSPDPGLVVPEASAAIVNSRISPSWVPRH